MSFIYRSSGGISWVGIGAISLLQLGLLGGTITRIFLAFNEYLALAISFTGGDYLTAEGVLVAGSLVCRSRPCIFSRHWLIDDYIAVYGFAFLKAPPSRPIKDKAGAALRGEALLRCCFQRYVFWWGHYYLAVVTGQSVNSFCTGRVVYCWRHRYSAGSWCWKLIYRQLKSERAYRAASPYRPILLYPLLLADQYLLLARRRNTSENEATTLKFS